jgi:bacterioferritin-associated ferredoxin
MRTSCLCRCSRSVAGSCTVAPHTPSVGVTSQCGHCFRTRMDFLSRVRQLCSEIALHSHTGVLVMSVCRRELPRSIDWHVLRDISVVKLLGCHPQQVCQPQQVVWATIKYKSSCCDISSAGNRLFWALILLFYYRILWFLRVILSALGNMRKPASCTAVTGGPLSGVKPATTASEHEPDRPLYFSPAPFHFLFECQHTTGASSGPTLQFDWSGKKLTSLWDFATSRDAIHHKASRRGVPQSQGVLRSEVEQIFKFIFPHTFKKLTVYSQKFHLSQESSPFLPIALGLARLNILMYPLSGD